MRQFIKYRLNEELTKADVKQEIDSAINSKSLEDRVSSIVKKHLKDNKELEDQMVDITKNVITQLYKTLWTKRGIWRSQLKNRKS